MPSRRWLLVAIVGVAVLGAGLTTLVPEEFDSAAPASTPTPGVSPTTESAATATPTRVADTPTDAPPSTGTPTVTPPSTGGSTATPPSAGGPTATAPSTPRPERGGGGDGETTPTVESGADGNVSGGATNDGTLRTYRSRNW